MIHHLLNPGPISARIDPSALGRSQSNEIEAVAAAVWSVLGEWTRETPRQDEGAPVFAERLLSLRHAEALSEGTRELLLAPGTVATPLARDFLKRQGVALRFVSTSEIARVRDQGKRGFAAETESGIIAALRRTLLAGSEPWEELDSFLDVMRWITEALSRGAMLLTDESSVAVWRACQIAEV